MAILPLLVAIALLIPGIIAYCAFSDKVWGRPLSLGSVSRDATTAVCLAIVLNLGWAGFIDLIAKYTHREFRVDFQSAIELLGGVSKDLQPITNYPWHVAMYFLSLWFFARFVGIQLGRLQITYGDSLPEMLRPASNSGWGAWAKAFRLTKLDGERVDLIWATAIVEFGGKAFEYSGVLLDFWPDRNGELDVLLLRGAVRFDPLNPDDQGYQIPSEVVYICHQDICVIETLPYKMQPEGNENDGELTDRVDDLAGRVEAIEAALKAPEPTA